MKTARARYGLVVCLTVFLCAYSGAQDKTAAPRQLPEGAEAMSLLGQPLYSPPPSQEALAQYAAAKAKYEKAPNSADALIWYGRRTAYLGKFKEAIKIYTEGIKRFPQDARFYRHRGHRYISLREFDKAISDFEYAAKLIHGKKDEIEPDGQPNAQNKPISSLHSNIWYHLALAYYLKNDMENALRASREGIKVSENDDKIVSTAHWLYMTLRRLGRKDEADKALAIIRPRMDVIENMAYHNLCLFYKGELPLEKLTGAEFTSIMNDAVAYGVGNWFFYNGQREKTKEIFQSLLKSKGWASFGYIAAEADYVREFKSRAPDLLSH